MAAPLLEAIDVRKRFGTRTALDGVSLRLWPGEVVGLLGPNGAGKTTTLAILATLLRPDGGRVLVNGASARGSSIALVPQSLALYPTLTVQQNLWHFARMQGLARAEARDACRRTVADVGLDERADDPVHALSGGMQRRLNLACAVVHRPEILLLDEPTVGVDLESREHLLRLVRRLRDQGTGIVYSTHYMEEAERICDRVLLIDRGILVASGTVEELIVLAGQRTSMELTYRGRLPDGWNRPLAGVRAVASSAAAGEVHGKALLELAAHGQITEVLAQVHAAGARVVDFNLRSANLADAFIALTGRALGDGPHA
ncbi:MAG TPA: ABC transporter ATP-binding protein [Candidatus Binatia bacterium]